MDNELNNTNSSPSDETTVPPVTIDPNQGDDNQGGKKSAEDRIQQILAKNKELERKLSEVEEKLAPPVVSQPTAQPFNPEIEKAKGILKQMGFVHQDELKQRDQVLENRMDLNSLHQKLESKYNGEDGRPTYDRREIEDYMRKRGIWGDPEDAYKLKHETEILDWTLKQAERKKGTKPVALRPNGSSSAPDDQTITREKLSEAMTTVEGRAWYEQNRSKIISLMEKGQL